MKTIKFNNLVDSNTNKPIELELPQDFVIENIDKITEKVKEIVKRVFKDEKPS